MKYFFIAVIIIAIAFVAKSLFFPDASPANLGYNQGNIPTVPVTQGAEQQKPMTTPDKTKPWAEKSTWVTNATQATIHTSKGDITIELYAADAPKTVTNFATLAKFKYFDGLTFHRVEPGFVIQGGDPNGNGTGGYSIYGDTFEDELNANTLSYKNGYEQGVVAMANRGPNTNGSQFFIMLADNQSLPKNYTIFGKVTTGMEVVKQIAVGDKMTSVEVK